MRCEICGNEYEGYFCDKCGWEEENILDDKYLEIYLDKKTKYKKIYEKITYYDEFFSKFIVKFNEYLKEDMNLAFYLKLVDDILEIIKDKKYYFELLILKILILKRLRKDYSKELKKAESFLDYSEILEEDKNFFNKLRMRL